MTLEKPDSPDIASEKQVSTPKTLFEMSPISTETSKQKKKSSGKIFTTEVEQPSLFDFD